ncbi:hypothetical protein HO434_07350 [Streptococcus suis]|uniref:DUF859 family phage minor structural protein n=1 Tax=Streptococcus suis TaxID=1307 RepID=UPI0015548014|nr:DUF859 family phage minor structural protein [Streptococcus suis]MCB2944704.1 hypothetical protein [Streptococcus suis]NQL90720.1 hypothetical protein [Streptococcus suis]HEM4167991.1 hypothetical protein [Streptococcus suis]
MAVFRYSGNWRGFLEGTSSTVSQDISGNSSVIKIDVWIGMDTGWNIEFGNTYGNTVTVTCDGQSQTIAVGPLYLNGSKKHLGSVQFRVGHNADGTKSAGIGLSSNMSNISYGTLNFGNASGNWVHGLTTIPRSSSVSVSPGVIGSALTININRQSSSFKHVVRYTWGNKSGTIATNVDTSTTWTIPLDFANDIPNTTSGTGTIFVDTYSGSTKTGTQQVAFIANVPASMKPTFSGVTLTDTNGAARSLLSGNNFLQIISNIQVNFNGASGSYSSTITGYKAEIVNRNLVTNSNGGTLGIMNFSGSATIRASVVDSRGRWSDTRDVTINVIGYFAPVLSYTATRTRENPNIIQIVRNAKIASITLSGSQKNIMTLSFKVAPLGSTSYTADNGSASGSWTTQHTLSNSAANMAGNYPANKSFTIIGTLSDKFTSVEFSATVATESVVMSYDKDGRVGIGKIANDAYKPGSLDVKGDIYAGDKQIQQHQLTSNDGYIVNDYYTDFDTNIKTGIYHKGVNNGVQTPNSPSKVWGILQVYSANNGSQVLQIFTERDSPRRMFIRLRSNSIWSDWEEYAKANHPMLQEKPLKTLTMGFPYSMKANLVRKGDVVTISLIRNIYSVDSFEHAVMQEKIPAGYKPVVDVHMTVTTNVSQFTKSPNILHFAPDGTIRMTSNTVGRHVMTGTITYITNDPYPA